MRIPIKPGLVFSIPIDETHSAIAQLVAKQPLIYYTVAYDILLDISVPVSVDRIVNAKPILVGNFYDNFLRQKRWTPLFHAQIPNIPFPYFKVVVDGRFRTVSWDRGIERLSTEEEARVLEFRANHSAMFLENALKGYFGKGPWVSHFESLKIENVRSNCELVLKTA